MSASNWLTLNPVWLLAAGSAGFAGWVAYDATRPVVVAPGDAEPADPDDRPTEVRHAPMFMTVHPGMPGHVVGHHLRGLPAEWSADPPAVDGFYRVHYQAFLPHPLPHAAPRGPFAPGPHVVTLTFDGRHPAHPLVEITTDPVA